MNNKIPQKLRLIATGSHTIGGIPYILSFLIQIVGGINILSILIQIVESIPNIFSFLIQIIKSIPNILSILIQIAEGASNTLSFLSQIETMLSRSALLFWTILAAIITQPIIVLSYWKITKNIHPFVDLSGRDAVNCALNTLLGKIASILFCTFIFSVTYGVGDRDPTLFFVSLFILCCVELAYFTNSVIAGIFSLRGYSFKSRLIYPFIKDY